MNSNRSPGFYDPVERHNAHRAWRPEGERVWNDQLRTAGDSLIDAYPKLAQGETPEYLEGARLSPGEFVDGIVSEQANGEDFWGFVEAMDLPVFDEGEDWDQYWTDLTDSVRNHAVLGPKAIDVLHRTWNDRCDTANDGPAAVEYKTKAAEWHQGFEYGVRRLIEKGRIPLTQAEFTARLADPAEVAYLPDYVLRLDFLRRGESGAAVPFGAFSDHNRGILYVKGIHDDEGSTRSRYVHENIHFYLDGVASVDTTLTTGETIPYDCHVGMWEVEPHLDPRMAELSQALGRKITSRHLELNEGATELINQEIHREVPELGTFTTRGNYAGWLAVWRFMESRGVDLTPFIGYKVTDQSYDRQNIANRFLWRFNMQEEFARVFNPSAYLPGKVKKGETAWDQFDEDVARITQGMNDPYDESPDRYIALLIGVPESGRIARILQRHRDEPFRPKDYEP